MKLQAVKKVTAKAVALLLAGTMVLGAGMFCSGKVYAVENPSVIDTEAKGSLAIERLEGTQSDAAVLEGVEFTAYKVMSLTKGADEKISYVPEEAFKTALGEVTPENLGDKSTEEMQTLVNGLLGVENKGDGKTSALTDGKYKISEMELGLYLVVETTTPAGYMASSPFLVSIPMANNYNTEEGATGWIYDVEAKAKNEKISLEKELAAETDNNDVVGVGDFVEYKVTATIPAYGPEYFAGDATVKFVISDIMDDGLEIQDGKDGSHPVTVKVKDVGADTDSVVEQGEGEGKNYDLTADPAEGETPDLTIDFTTAFIKAHPGASVTVTYFAEVTEKAVMGTDGNSNKANLTYSNRPGTDSEGNPYTDETPDEEVKVYTFGIQVVKFRTENGTKEVLPGAKFALYRDAGLKEPAVKEEDGTAKVLTAGENGILEFSGLDEGTYYLKETESPAGYTLLANPVVIEITAEKDEEGKATGTFALKVDGSEITAVTDIGDASNKFTTTLSKVEIDDSITSTGIANIAVENHKGFSLPSTGGMGVTLFLIVGAAGIIGLSIVMTRKPKKQK